MHRLTAVDLFSGCGGLTQGLATAGFCVLGAVDNDDLAVETYQANHPSVSVWHQDIRSVSGANMRRRLRLRIGQLDLLAGCPPCQGFSSLRTANGSRRVRDDRNDLVGDFMRLVGELRPKTVMMENVPGLVDDRRFRVLLNSLTDAGYLAKWAVLNTMHYGVPQRRRRLILLASRFGVIEFSPPSAVVGTVRAAIACLRPPGGSGDMLHDCPEHRTGRVRDLIRRIPLDGGGRIALGTEEQLPCHVRCDGYKDVYGRMAWDKPAPTITSGCYNPSKGRFLHPEQHRCITLREAALLQGLPADYHISLRRGKTGAAALIGNALPPGFVYSHALRVREHLLRWRSRKRTVSA